MPLNENVVRTLRERKQRPTKPFALMYPNLELLEKDLEVGMKQKEVFLNSQSPILLLPPKKNPRSSLCLDGIAPGLLQLGVMMPYTPLFALLMREYGQPVIATSGNISNSPIVFTDEKALGPMTRIADYILTNNRDIVIPQDDSVVTLQRHMGKKLYSGALGVLLPPILTKTSNYPKRLF